MTKLNFIFREKYQMFFFFACRFRGFVILRVLASILANFQQPTARFDDLITTLFYTTPKRPNRITRNEC